MTGLNVGLDFGTSNSGVAVYDGSQVRVLPIDQKNLVPEVVKTILYITKDQRAYIGQEAVDLYYRHNINRPRRFVKKWAGELEYHGSEVFYVRDVYVYVDELKPGRLLQYIKTALRSKDYRGTDIFERYYELSDIICIYLLELKTRAEALLGDKISGVTLGRPVQFAASPEQDRRSEEILRQAAEQAGFKQISFEFEPVAAALYYEKSLAKPQNVLIFDFGGGTLDLTVMRLGDPRRRKVYASGGIGIAGTDFDKTIIQKRMLPHFGLGMVSQFPEIQELILSLSDWQIIPDLSTPKVKYTLEQAINQGAAPVQLKALEALVFNDLAFSFYNQVEAAKIRLSNQGVAVIQLSDKYLNLWELYTRFQFESDIEFQRKQIEQVVLDTVVRSGLEPEQIDAVVKTGGSSSIPLFTSMLGDIFRPERIVETNVFSSVTAGLAIRAFEIQHRGS